MALRCDGGTPSALADVPKDRPITGRHLLRHEAEPGGKVASFGKGSAVGNGRNHRTCDERTNAWNRHYNSGNALLSVSHQGLFVASTISFNLLPGASLGQAECRARIAGFAPASGPLS
jgi:hypothetical protein